MLQWVEELGIEIGIEQGMEKEAKSLVVRILNKKFKYLDEGIKTQIENLEINEVENLGEALIDMSKIEDLENWFSNLIK